MATVIGEKSVSLMYLTKCLNSFTLFVHHHLSGKYINFPTHIHSPFSCAPAVGGRTRHDYITFLMGLFRSKILTFMPPAVPAGKLSCAAVSSCSTFCFCLSFFVSLLPPNRHQ